MFWLSWLLPSARRIFDVGGCGLTFYPYVELPAGLQWMICDPVAALLQDVEVARPLRFTSDFEDADGADILLAPEPLGDRLARLRRKPQHLILTCAAPEPPGYDLIDEWDNGGRYFRLSPPVAQGL